MSLSCHMCFALWVKEALWLVSIVSLEAVFSETYRKVRSIWCFVIYSGLTDNRLCKTFSAKRAVGGNYAVACLSINIFSGSARLICTLMVLRMLVLWLYLILMVFLLKILCSEWLGGNSVSTRSKKFCQCLILRFY